MKKTIAKQQKQTRRHARIRSRVFGTAERPRLAVHKSNSHLTAQVINDETGETLVHGTSTAKAITGASMMERAQVVGQKVAKDAQSKGVTRIVFDRGGYQYTGIVKALADSIRDAGIQF